MELGEDGSDATFPESLPESDRDRWDAMTLNQRARARRRLDAIVAWRAGEMPLADALAAADLSRTRFYAVAASFRDVGNLESLGAFAGSGAMRKRLDADVVNTLQAVVPSVVALNKGASVNQLVQLMVAAANLSGKAPATNLMRTIVETELRRVEATGQAGWALAMDFTAINLPRADGRPHILFTVIDVGTRIVLGWAMSGDTDERIGYRDAARHALERIRGPLSSLQWSDRLMRVDIVVAMDTESAAAFRERLMDGRVDPPVGLSPNRLGRYFRKFVGERVGRIAITPLRTLKGKAVADNGELHAWTDEAARGAVNLVIEQHNADMIAEMKEVPGRPTIPDDMARVLGLLAE